MSDNQSLLTCDLITFSKEIFPRIPVERKNNIVKQETQVERKRTSGTCASPSTIGSNYRLSKDMPKTAPLLSVTKFPTQDVQDAQHIAMKRVLKVIEKQKYLMENNEAALEKKLRIAKMQEKINQRNRYRAEIYAINALLKKQEQERFLNFIEYKGGSQLSESDDDDDSCDSHSDSDEEPNESVSKTGIDKKAIKSLAGNRDKEKSATSRVARKLRDAIKENSEKIEAAQRSSNKSKQSISFGV